jgi:hypothetical protein
MIISFSEYLKENNFNNYDISSLKNYAQCWFRDLMATITSFQNFFPKIFLPVFRRANLKVHDPAILKELDTLLDFTSQKQLSGTDLKKRLIQVSDDYFFRLTKMLTHKSTQFLRNNPIRFAHDFYPFTGNVSGVKMVCRIRLADGSLLKSIQFEAKSMHGTFGEEAKSIRARVVSSQGVCEWLNKALNNLKINIAHSDLIDLGQPHAEDDWFPQFGQQLINKILENKEILLNTFASRHFPISFLIGPRIEFVMSTSPCETCQAYFRALGQALKDRGINIPIVIFSHAPYNTKEPDFAIFIVNQACRYQMLPFQWSNSKVLLKNALALSEKSVGIRLHTDPESINLNQDYRAILILNIFGDALLPSLTRSDVSTILLFIESLIDMHSTNYVMLDWVKYYAHQLLVALPYDFTNTSASVLALPATYKTVDFKFLASYNLSASMRKYAQSIAKVAATKNNALLFFILLKANWPSLLYRSLKRSDAPAMESLKPSPELVACAQEVSSSIFWDLSSAPNEAIYRSTYPDMPDMVCNQEALDFYRHTNSLFSFIHFIEIAAEFQRNILNSMLTHPDTSPLGTENEDYDDENISLLIYQVRAGIYELAFKQDRWDMRILERIFNAFREQRFDPELVEVIKRMKAARAKLVTPVNRIFSREQVVADRQIYYLFVKPSCPDSPPEPIPESVKKESLLLAMEEGIIGPRSIRGWILKDVLDLGNCFYDAVIHQMQLINHPFLADVPAGTLPRDSLRLFIQGADFQDEQWADDKVIDEFAKRFNLILAIVDTLNPDAGFVCYYANEESEVITNAHGEMPLPRVPIIRLAATGNHFLSVLKHPNLARGSINDSFSTIPNFSNCSMTFFKQLHEEYIIENRHKNADIQHTYDKRFGLTLM